MKQGLTAIFLMIAGMVSGQQIADSVYWVYFKDKSGNGYDINQPEKFLSDLSISRRAWQKLSIDHTDEPVNSAYVSELREMGVTIRHISRWLNGVVMVNLADSLFLKVLEKPFTDTVPWEPATDDIFLPPAPSGSRFEVPLTSAPSYNYGIATEQIQMLDMDILHEKGYTGKGVRIAVFDEGFRNVDSLPSFETMIAEGRVLGTRNFVDEIPLFRQETIHGMSVLSIIGAEWNGNLVGTAPHASFYLCMTEDPHQETRVEEIAWIEAAEYVDSLGFDVINTSLGYSDFDSTVFDYTYSDMDGMTTFISRAASMTASKGIIACVSAGNEGNKSWKYITAPADASDILAVGAVDSTNMIAALSSRGPSSDGRIKPDVAAMGFLTGKQSISGDPSRGNGTSYSSPLIAGSVASLWQAYPEVPAKELIQMVRESSDRIENPGPEYGYGLPNFALAYWSIKSVPAISDPGQLEIYPNPASSHIMVRVAESSTEICPLRFLDMSGRVVYSVEIRVPCEVNLPYSLNNGIYILEMKTKQGIYRSRLIKM